MEKIEINKQKIKEFILKNRLWIGMLIVSVMLFLCLKLQNIKSWQLLIVDFNAIQILTIVIIVSFSAVLNIGDAVCFSMFLSLFSNVGYVFIVGAASCLISVLVRFIINVKKKKKQVHFVPLFVILGIVLIYSLINHGFGESGTTMGFMIVYVAALLFLIFENKDEINISKCFTAIFYGLVVSLAVVAALHGYLGDIIYDSNLYNKRIRLFSYHTNFLSMHAMFQIAYSIYSIFKKERKLYIDIFAILFSLICGIGTKSKAFLLVLVLILVYVIVCLIKKYKKKSLIYLSGLLVLVLVCAYLERDYLKSVIERFGDNYYGDSLLTTITTGRNDIWEIYLRDWSSSPSKIFFGAGIFTNEPYYLGIHNTYLFILYRFGVVGTILIVSFLVNLLKKCKFNFDIYNFTILAIWLLLALEEVVLSDQFAIYLILGIIMCLKPTENTMQKEDENKIVDAKSCKINNNNIK